MEQKLVGFLFGRLAVIPGDCPGDAGRYRAAFQLFKFLKHLFRHVSGVRAFPLRHGQGDGRQRRPSPRVDEGLRLLFVLAVGDLRYFRKLHRVAVPEAYYRHFQVFDGADEGIGLYEHAFLFPAHAAGGQPAVGLGDDPRQLQGRQPPLRELLRVEMNQESPLAASDQIGFRNLRYRAYLFAYRGRGFPQRERVRFLAVEGQGQDRHVVYGTLFDQGLASPGRQEIRVRGDLGEEPRHGFFRVQPHFEADDEHGEIGLGGGIDVFHAGDLHELALSHADDPVLHLFGRRAREGHDDIEHRHRDLRFFLPRKHHGGEDPHKEARDHQERRYIGADESLGDSAGKAHFRCSGHFNSPESAALISAVLASSKFPEKNMSAA